MNKLNKKTLSMEAVKFVAIGAVNTAIDFSILNILVSLGGWERIPANFVSVSIAMVFSFFANKLFVFKTKSGSARKQGLQFILVTAFGLYVLQNGAIYTLTELWHWPLDWLTSWFTLFEKEFVITNGAKAAATAITLVWNFVFYKFIVFKDDSNA